MELPYLEPLIIRPLAERVVPEPPRRGEPGGEPCGICAVGAPGAVPENEHFTQAVWENEHFTLHAPVGGSIPGAMLLASREHLTAPFVLTQVLFPMLRQSKDPSIIFTSSGVGRVGKAYWGAYSVSKFGTESLSQILAAENLHTSLRSNCVNPGPVRTRMRQAAYPAEDRDALMRPEDILSTYMYLLGPDSQGVTGKSFDLQ